MKMKIFFNPFFIGVLMAFPIFGQFSPSFLFEKSLDSLYKPSNFFQSSFRPKRQNINAKKFYKPWFYLAKKDDYHILFAPIVNASFGYKKENTRGIMALGHIGKHIDFFTSFEETQIFYPKPLYQIAQNKKRIVFGKARGKLFQKNGIDAGVSKSAIRYHNAFLSVEFGHGHQFIGRGNRSLFLSYNPTPYTYTLYNVKLGKFTFSNYKLWLIHQNRSPIQTSSEALLERSMVSIHKIAFRPKKNINLEIIERTIYQNGLYRSMPIGFYQPIIGANFFQSQNAHLQSSSIGYNVDYSPFENTTVYHQLNLLPKQKISTQFGIKQTHKNGFFRLEYNELPNATPFAKNQVQSIDHPLENGIREGLLENVFTLKKWGIQNTISLYQTARKTNHIFASNTLFFLIHPIYTLQIFASHYYFGKQNQSFFVGIKTALFQQYENVR